MSIQSNFQNKLVKFNSDLLSVNYHEISREFPINAFENQIVFNNNMLFVFNTVTKWTPISEKVNLTREIQFDLNSVVTVNKTFSSDYLDYIIIEDFFSDVIYNKSEDNNTITYTFNKEVRGKIFIFTTQTDQHKTSVTSNKIEGNWNEKRLGYFGKGKIKPISLYNTTNIVLFNKDELDFQFNQPYVLNVSRPNLHASDRYISHQITIFNENLVPILRLNKIINSKSQLIIEPIDLNNLLSPNSSYYLEVNIISEKVSLGMSSNRLLLKTNNLDRLYKPTIAEIIGLKDGKLSVNSIFITNKLEISNVNSLTKVNIHVTDLNNEITSIKSIDIKTGEDFVVFDLNGFLEEEKSYSIVIEFIVDYLNTSLSTNRYKKFKSDELNFTTGKDLVDIVSLSNYVPQMMVNTQKCFFFSFNNFIYILGNVDYSTDVKLMKFSLSSNVVEEVFSFPTFTSLQLDYSNRCTQINDTLFIYNESLVYLLDLVNLTLNVTGSLNSPNALVRFRSFNNNCVVTNKSGYTVLNVGSQEFLINENESTSAKVTLSGDDLYILIKFFSIIENESYISLYKFNGTNLTLIDKQLSQSNELNVFSLRNKIYVANSSRLYQLNDIYLEEVLHNRLNGIIFDHVLEINDTNRVLSLVTNEYSIMYTLI